jgi:hypothetical protein
MARFVVDFMRGYGREWWVRDNTNPDSVQSYAARADAVRYAELMEAGVRREVALHAVSARLQVIRAGDLAFLDSLGAGLVPVKVVEVKRVPVPDAPNDAYTQVEATLRVTAARPGYRRGELLTRTGQFQTDQVIPRKNVRSVDGQIRIRSGVFDA